MPVTGARLTTLEEEAEVPTFPHRDDKEELCAERLIVKLSTGNSLACRKWFKFRHNLEAFRAKKECVIMLTFPPSSLPLVELHWNYIQAESTVILKGCTWLSPLCRVTEF